MIKPVRGRREVFDAIRVSTLRMFNSVLYTKQHSLIDVAFGILCAEIVFERRFDFPFDNFIDTFETMKAEHSIPYDVIAEAYEEAVSIYARRKNLSDTLGEYLRHHEYPLVRAGRDTELRYFDTKQKRIVSR